MLKGLLRFGSELPLQCIVGVLGVQDGVLGSDRPPLGSGCEEEPERKSEMTKTEVVKEKK